jgi:hypothetical protein
MVLIDVRLKTSNGSSFVIYVTKVILAIEMDGSGNIKSEARRTSCKLFNLTILVFGDRRMSSECAVGM